MTTDLTHSDLLRRAGRELGDLSRLMLDAADFGATRLRAALDVVAGAQPLTPPRIGQPWPGQGGIYVGIMRGAAGQPDHHLIIAERDASVRRMAYGSYGTDMRDAASILDGAANTRALLAHGGHPAAAACAVYTADGHSDFFLPAQGQLMLCFANAREAVGKGVYLSSTQTSPHLAFVQDFENGDSGWGNKGNSWRVHPFRGLPLESLNTLNSAVTAEGGSP